MRRARYKGAYTLPDSMDKECKEIVRDHLKEIFTYSQHGSSCVACDDDVDILMSNISGDMNYVYRAHIVPPSSTDAGFSVVVKMAPKNVLVKQ